MCRGPTETSFLGVVKIKIWLSAAYLSILLNSSDMLIGFIHVIVSNQSVGLSSAYLTTREAAWTRGV